MQAMQPFPRAQLPSPLVALVVCTMPWKHLCQILVGALPRPATCDELLELSARMILTGQPYLRLLRLTLAPDKDLRTIRATCTSDDTNGGAVVSKDQDHATPTPCKPSLTIPRRSSLIFPSDLGPSYQGAAERLSRLTEDASAASPAMPITRMSLPGTSPTSTTATPFEAGRMGRISLEETRHALFEVEQVLRDSMEKIKCVADLCERVSMSRKRKRDGVVDLELCLEKRTKIV